MSEASINFFSEDIDFQLNDQATISNWVTKVIQNHQKIVGDINYIFCSDTYLHEINVSYLSHDTYTDIITFNQSTDELVTEADIYISIERVKENAGNFEVDFDHELRRVMIHGILHLLGFEDHSTEEKQEMRRMEEESLALLSS